MKTDSATHYRWDDILQEQVSPLLQRRLLWGEQAMLAQVRLEQGCLIPKHQHRHEQFTYVLEGALRFWLGEDEAEEMTARAGDVVHFPGNLWHKAEVLETALLLDVFSPPREDWIQKTDDYLRR